MTENQTSSRLPLITAIVCALLLAGVGSYVWMRSKPALSEPNDKAATASEDAASALAASGMSGKDKAAMEAVVRAYILEHPEVITDAVEILQHREILARIGAAGTKLGEPFPGAETGNSSGDVTIVEFTDYSCGFCRASVADMNRLIKDDGNIRVIYRELPILAPESREAALWALAAAKQGKHKAFHDAMFEIGRPDANTIRAAATKAGVNVAQAASFAKSAEARAEVESNLAMMQQIGFNGTPTFIIGGQMLEGALGYDAIKAAVAKARKAKA